MNQGKQSIIKLFFGKLKRKKKDKDKKKKKKLVLVKEEVKGEIKEEKQKEVKEVKEVLKVKKRITPKKRKVVQIKKGNLPLPKKDNIKEEVNIKTPSIEKELSPSIEKDEELSPILKEVTDNKENDFLKKDEEVVKKEEIVSNKKEDNAFKPSKPDKKGIIEEKEQEEIKDLKEQENEEVIPSGFEEDTNEEIIPNIPLLDTKQIKFLIGQVEDEMERHKKELKNLEKKIDTLPKVEQEIERVQIVTHHLLENILLMSALSKLKPTPLNIIVGSLLIGRLAHNISDTLHPKEKEITKTKITYIDYGREITDCLEDTLLAKKNIKEAGKEIEKVKEDLLSYTEIDFRDYPELLTMMDELDEIEESLEKQESEMDNLEKSTSKIQEKNKQKVKTYSEN